MREWTGEKQIGLKYKALKVCASHIETCDGQLKISVSNVCEGVWSAPLALKLCQTIFFRWNPVQWAQHDWKFWVSSTILSIVSENDSVWRVCVCVCKNVSIIAHLICSISNICFIFLSSTEWRGAWEIHRQQQLHWKPQFETDLKHSMCIVYTLSDGLELSVDKPSQTISHDNSVCV